mmetsp:Transcript_3474/g.6262  ORF Transcript_3474/g.6262 Transcript_3474/m.6262 type:complete len:318 (-) Transcript_3474:210-1163(-)
MPRRKPQMSDYTDSSEYYKDLKDYDSSPSPPPTPETMARRRAREAREAEEAARKRAAEEKQKRELAAEAARKRAEEERKQAAVAKAEAAKAEAERRARAEAERMRAQEAEERRQAAARAVAAETESPACEPEPESDMNPEVRRVYEVFERHDSDRNGRIDKHELRGLLNAFGMQTRKIDVIFHLIASTSDGAIDRNSFLRWAFSTGRGSVMCLFTGSRVQGKLASGGKWYPGTVLAEGEGTWDIRYDDGHVETGVPADAVRPFSLTIGDRVDVTKKSSEMSCAAVISSVNSNGTWDVEFEDGDFEANVESSRIAALI